MLSDTVKSKVRRSQIKTLLMAFGAMGLSLAAQAQSSGQQPDTSPPVAVQKPDAVQKPVVVRAVDDASAPAGWKRYEIGEGPLISIFLPSQPKEFSEQKSLGGAKLSTMRAYTSETEEAVYTAFYAEDLPFIAEQMPENVRDSFFKGMWQGFTNGVQKGMEEKGLLFKLTSLPPRPIIINNLNGVEQDFTFGPMKGRAQMALTGQRAFMALAFWAEDAPDVERTAFFNSFRIGVKR